jgi:hypothetical protein
MSILLQYICCQAITFRLGSTYIKGRAMHTLEVNVKDCSYSLQYIDISLSITIT